MKPIQYYLELGETDKLSFIIVCQKQYLPEVNKRLSYVRQYQEDHHYKYKQLTVSLTELKDILTQLVNSMDQKANLVHRQLQLIRAVESLETDHKGSVVYFDGDMKETKKFDQDHNLNSIIT